MATHSDELGAVPRSRQTLSRVPEVTLYFWIIKVLTTGMGETASDWPAHLLGPIPAVGLGVPYLMSTPFFLLALGVVFAIWYGCEKTLSIHSIRTRRREVFYWATVLATFALGTAAGDLTATTLGLGYLGSGVMFAVAIAVPAIAHRRFGLGPIAAFWSAYVVTRPLGASFADWMAVSSDRGGLAWGLGPVTLYWTIAILAFVGYLAATRKDVA
ncbi:hypothetical protein OG607_06160 [Streptomyces sp. NBC_01537]|uniref:COG4705 family protein n=1 Tax=Streptomyces sp. NBC_01537 TaxID=2903896 RepID=UPI00386C6B02